VALALDGLIRSQFPQDSLHIIGFSSYAREIKKEDLATLRLDQSDPTPHPARVGTRQETTGKRKNAE